MNRIGQILLLGLVLTGLVGCGDEDKPGPDNISGIWTGTQQTSTGRGNVALTLEDNSGVITGTEVYQQTHSSVYWDRKPPAPQQYSVSGTYKPDNGRLVITCVRLTGIDAGWYSIYHYSVRGDNSMHLNENKGYTSDGRKYNAAKIESTLVKQD